MEVFDLTAKLLFQVGLIILAAGLLSEFYFSTSPCYASALACKTDPLPLAAVIVALVGTAVAGSGLGWNYYKTQARSILEGRG